MRFIVVYLSLNGFLFAQPGTVPAGTLLEARLETSIATATSEIGDDVVAVFTQPVRFAGKIAVPQGTRLHGRVETVQAATRNNEGHVRLVFREIQLPDGRRLPVWITNSFGADPPKRGLKYALLMGSGAAAGAFIGGKSARVAGILGGLLTGFVIANNSAPSKLPDVRLRAGREIDLELREDLILP
jgi:hypothetical protein